MDRPRSSVILAAALAAIVTAALGAGERATAESPARDSATSPAGEAAAARKSTRVGYLAGGSVYLEAGRADGLLEGDTLRIVRSGRLIAVLRVAFLASHRASCDTLSTTEAVRVGDRASFVPHAAAAPPREAASGGTPQPLARSEVAAERRPRLRGRAGTQFIATRSGVSSLSQPAFSLFLEQRNALDGRLDVLSDVRARLTVHTIADTARSQQTLNRVYRLAISLHDRRDRLRLTLGRQNSPATSSSGLIDGARFEWTGSRWGAGIYSGAQPDPVRLSLSSDILEHGIFVGLRSIPGASRRWSITTGGATSTDQGQANRDYLFAQGNYGDRRLNLYASQEVDWNGGWKRSAGEPALSPTSTFVNAGFRALRQVRLSAGYDHRRNARLYRDKTTPEDEFDDRYRTGGWTGASIDIGRRLRTSGDVHFRGGGSGASTSPSASIELHRLPLRARLRARASRYASDVSRTQLWTVAAGFAPLGERLSLDFGHGQRSTRDPSSGIETAGTWETASLDLTPARHVFFSASCQWEHGDLSDAREAYTSLSYRF